MPNRDSWPEVRFSGRNEGAEAILPKQVKHMLRRLVCLIVMLVAIPGMAQEPESPPATPPASPPAPQPPLDVTEPEVAQPQGDPDSTNDPLTSFAELCEFLDEQQIAYEKDGESQYVIIETQQGPIDSVMVIRWALSDGVVHFFQVMPLELPAERIPPVESAIIRLNHAYPVPGLGMNHEANALYFRFTVPILPRGFLSEIEVSEYFNYTVNQAAALFPTMQAVIQGTVPPAEALAFHNANAAGGPKGPYGTWTRELVGSVWKLTINQEDGAVQLTRDDTVVVNSTATVEENTITFQDQNGPLATNEPGQYQFTLNGDGTITFEAVNEPSKGRRQVLTGEPWSR